MTWNDYCLLIYLLRIGALPTGPRPAEPRPTATLLLPKSTV